MPYDADHSQIGSSCSSLQHRRTSWSSQCCLEKEVSKICRIKHYLWLEGVLITAQRQVCMHRRLS